LMDLVGSLTQIVPKSHTSYRRTEELEEWFSQPPQPSAFDAVYL